jgi:SAM-dependent methyltransferase
MGTAPEALREKLRSMWIAGDFGRIAMFTQAEAEKFVDRLAIRPGARVLDVACGTGNLAIPAARKGAIVTGIDIAPNLVEQARRRADQEKLRVAFEEGDAEQLPYNDASFDLVMTMYGAMFAPHPEVAAREMARVCRPGGTIAMANWTPGGFAGQMFKITACHVAPPEGMPAPSLWGDPAVVRERLGPYASRIETTPREMEFDYPFPPQDAVKYFREHFGPSKTAFARLDAAGQSALAEDMEAHWSKHNQGGNDHTLVRSEYLEVIATRA